MFSFCIACAHHRNISVLIRSDTVKYTFTSYLWLLRIAPYWSYQSQDCSSNSITYQSTCKFSTLNSVRRTWRPEPRLRTREVRLIRRQSWNVNQTILEPKTSINFPTPAATIARNIGWMLCTKKFYKCEFSKNNPHSERPATECPTTSMD